MTVAPASLPGALAGSWTRTLASVAVFLSTSAPSTEEIWYGFHAESEYFSPAAPDSSRVRVSRFGDQDSESTRKPWLLPPSSGRVDVSPSSKLYFIWISTVLWPFRIGTFMVTC